MEEINLSEMFRYFISKFYIIIIALAAALTVWLFYGLQIKTPLYQSSATVILAGKDTAYEEYNQTDQTLNKSLTKTYSEIIKSRKVLGSVIKKLNLKYTTDELSKMITVSNVEDTEIIKVTVSSTDNEEAKEIANAIIPVFSDEVSHIYKFDNISILDKAIVSENPYNMNALKDIIIFSMVGIILGFGIVFCMFYFDNTIRSKETIEEKYGLNVIGVIPLVNKER